MDPVDNKSEIHLSTPIQQFYAGQNVFITGGTGFLGRILIEKLLRSCPDISSIYVLIRVKKGQDMTQRVENLFEDAIFERLKKEVPKFRQKIVPIPGDCVLPELGLSVTDRNLLARKISIVFNVAATVRFDEKIKDAVAINIAASKEILNLSRTMSNLRAIIHVSTAYSNCPRREIDEKFYDSPISGESLMKLVESLDESKLEEITPMLLGNYPNTYAYTKQIAEQVVQQYGKNLPAGIFRPAIVISTYKEPIEGWIDNIFGPTGGLVGSGVGLIRTVNADRNCTAELVPVDYTVNALIATAWDVANNKNEAADPTIYNYTSSWNNNITWGNYTDLAFEYGRKIPSLKSVWCYSMTITKNPIVYYILTVLLHILPALLVDIGLCAIGQKPKALKIYKKIHKFSAVTAHFSTRTWEFSNANTKSLWKHMTSEDKEMFYFSMYDFDWTDFMKKCVIGLRIHTLKDDPSTIPIARKRMARLLILHKTIKWGFFGLVTWLLYFSIAFAFSLGSTSTLSTVPESLPTR